VVRNVLIAMLEWLAIWNCRALTPLRGGAQGGGRPRPSGFCAAAGRERASGPTRRAKWAKKWFALANSGQRDLVKTSR
jgi:hypothetical protein